MSSAAPRSRCSSSRARIASPARLRPLQELHGDKLVVTYDPDEGSTLVLEIGYALARARVLMARAAAEGVDAVAIEEAAKRAIELLGQVKAIKGGLTAARTQIGKSADAVDVARQGRPRPARRDLCTRPAGRSTRRAPQPFPCVTSRG